MERRPSDLVSVLQYTTRRHLGSRDASYFGLHVQSSLPTAQPGHDAKLIFFSALVIEVVRLGIETVSSNLETSRHLTSIAEGLYAEIESSHWDSQRCSDIRGLRLAIHSAQDCRIRQRCEEGGQTRPPTA